MFQRPALVTSPSLSDSVAEGRCHRETQTGGEPHATCNQVTQTISVEPAFSRACDAEAEHSPAEQCRSDSSTAGASLLLPKHQHPVPLELGTDMEAECESAYSPSQSDSEASDISSDGVCFKAMSRDVIREHIKQDPSRYIGVSPQHLWIVSLLAEKISYENRGQSLSKEDVVLMTLFRVRQNLPNHLLADFFGVSQGTISRLLSRALPEIGNCLNELVAWPSRQAIRDNLPHAFLANYSSCESIIDCFEVEIQKPALAVSQSMSWSDYKKANSVKYLISATPDGLINFVSGGRPGRSTDMDLVRQSGYLDCLRSGATVLADRGFKELEPELAKRGCSLVRPPSVQRNEALSAGQVVKMRTIAGLRIHVERVIARVRVFKMLAMHSRIPLSMIDLVDSIVRVVCGLVNLQQRIVRS